MFKNFRKSEEPWMFPVAILAGCKLSGVRTGWYRELSRDHASVD